MEEAGERREMYVLVTGAPGYTGSRVADGLLAAGHRVSGLARSVERPVYAADLARELEERGIRAVRRDITDAESVREAARGGQTRLYTPR